MIAMASDEPFYSPNHKPTPPQTERLPGEPLWRLLRNGSDRVTAELRTMPIGFEVQLFRP
jgi:hypothetical protein